MHVDEGGRYFLQTTFCEGYEMLTCADSSKTGHRDLIAGVAAMIVGTRQNKWKSNFSQCTIK